MALEWHRILDLRSVEGRTLLTAAKKSLISAAVVSTLSVNYELGERESRKVCICRVLPTWGSCLGACLSLPAAENRLSPSPNDSHASESTYPHGVASQSYNNYALRDQEKFAHLPAPFRGRYSSPEGRYSLR